MPKIIPREIRDAFLTTYAERKGKIGVARLWEELELRGTVSRGACEKWVHDARARRQFNFRLGEYHAPDELPPMPDGLPPKPTFGRPATPAPPPNRKIRRADRAKIGPEVLAMLREGHTAVYVAEMMVMSVDTVERWRAKWRKEGELEATTDEQLAKLARAKSNDPIPYDELDDESRTVLDDFALFRPEIFGRSSPPWATMCATRLTELFFMPGEQYAVCNFNPGLGKSTVITHDWCLWLETLVRSKGIELVFVLGHRSDDKAKLYIHRLRRTMESNAELIRRYGRFKPDRAGTRWSNEALDVQPLRWSDLQQKEATFNSASYEKSILSVRPDVMVWDDLIDKSNAANADQREKMFDWWDQEAETRLEPDGLLVLSNARYGPEDLSWQVRQQLDDEETDELGQPRPIYEHIALPAHDESRCERAEVDGRVKLTHGGPWPDGCLLDPVRTSWRRLRKAMGNSRRFELVWQQADVDPVGFLAQRVWFEGGRDSKGAISPGCLEHGLRFGQLFRPEAPALSMITVDPSGAKWWSVQHIVGWADRVHQVYRGKRAIMQAPDLLYRNPDGTYSGLLHEWYEAARDEGEGVLPTYLVVEHQSQQRWLTQYEFVQTWCSERGVALVPHSTTKQTKPDPDRGVEMLGPIYQFGRVRIPYGGGEERAFADQFIKEACAWPEGSTWDLVMGHWFYAFRSDPLLVAHLAAEAAADDYDDDDQISWVSQRMRQPAPRWAEERLAGLTRR